MPRRIATSRVQGGPQGDDAWVELRHLTFGEMRAPSGFEAVARLYLEAARLEQQAKDAEGSDPMGAESLRVEARTVLERAAEARLEADQAILRRRVVAWNWCDEEGVPLPQPAECPEVLDGLTAGERRFLLGALRDLERRQEDELKNCDSSS